MKSLLLSSLLCCFCAITFAQNEYLQAAEKYFSKGDYFSASQYYEKYLAGEKPGAASGFNPYAVSASANRTAAVTVVNKETVLYKLAESYRLLNYHEKAEPHYIQLVGSGTKFPLARYHLATTQRAMAKYDEAATHFTTFLSEYKETDNYSENARRELQNLQYIKSQLVKKDLHTYTINKAPAGLNEAGGNYAPVWINNTLYFTSTRANTSDKNDVHVNRVYEADYSGGTLGNVVVTAINQPAKMEQGVIAVSPDGNTVFLTRWTVNKELKTSSIFSSRKTGKKWSTPVLSASLNATGSNAQQPFIMPDGKHIVFSSDRAGGNGGFDLWYAELDSSGKAGSPVNLGTTINTKYDEQAPSYHAASNTFIFSTNGRTGMGGYDFFYSKGSINNFAEPVNFGYPVNSIKDDIYFASKGSSRYLLDDVILSSDREAACCLELFSLNKKRPLKTIEGTVVACDTKTVLAGATISFVDPVTNKVIVEKTTDASGTYSFTLEEFQDLKGTATLSGYYTNSIRFNQPTDAEADNLVNMPLCLTVIPKEAITIDNVYYDFNKATLQDESFPSLDKLVALLNENPTMQIELGAHTDSKGSDLYNLRLSQARAQSVVTYLISKGISSDRLISKGYGESVPVQENTNADGTDNPEGRQKNRRTEFRVIKN